MVKELANWTRLSNAINRVVDAKQPEELAEKGKAKPVKTPFEVEMTLLTSDELEEIIREANGPRRSSILKNIDLL